MSSSSSGYPTADSEITDNPEKVHQHGVSFNHASCPHHDTGATHVLGGLSDFPKPVAMTIVLDHLQGESTLVKKFVYAVNSMPFSGKIGLGIVAHSYWNATSIKAKSRSFVVLLLLLAIFIFGHGLQASMAFQALQTSQSILLSIVFITYGLVNIAVVIAQIHLLFRALRLLTKRLPKRARKYVEMGCGTEILCVVVTLLGQIIFLIAYFIAGR
jgi:hypothetical protein